MSPSQFLELQLLSMSQILESQPDTHHSRGRLARIFVVGRLVRSAHVREARDGRRPSSQVGYEEFFTHFFFSLLLHFLNLPTPHTHTLAPLQATNHGPESSVQKIKSVKVESSLAVDPGHHHGRDEQCYEQNHPADPPRREPRANRETMRAGQKNVAGTN